MEEEGSGGWRAEQRHRDEGAKRHGEREELQGGERETPRQQSLGDPLRDGQADVAIAVGGQGGADCQDERQAAHREEGESAGRKGPLVATPQPKPRRSPDDGAARIQAVPGEEQRGQEAGRPQLQDPVEE